VLILWKPFCFVVVMIDICCKHLKRRTDFRFLAVHTCVISIMFLTNHGGSTSTAMSTATIHATTRLHLQMYYQSRPMDGGRLRWPVSPYPRHSGLRCRSVYRTLELSYAQATCQLQALKSLPDTLARIYRHCKRDSCVRKLTGWKIDDLACGCVFIHQN
jgi:hypothetical protein